MSGLMLRRTVMVGGAAALAMTAWFVGRAGSLSAADSEVTPAFSNVAVDCEPAQQALVRQMDVNGEPRTVVQCVTSPATAAAFEADGGPVLASPRLVPAVYRPPVAAPVRTVAAPARPVSAAAAAPQRPVERVTQPEPKRSWKTRAMVIGGSAGAGAGIGALIGGKKGALIGAAIGGGSGTVYEVVKH